MASNNKSVEKEAFLNQTTITAVSFGKDCKTVEESAFKNCSELSNINDDNKIENIGAYAFAHVSLINVSLPKAENIGNNAFEGCSKLTNVTINNNCSFIGKGAFKDCGKLESVRIPNNNKFKTISENTFQNCAILSITIPNNVTTIGSGAFNGCGKLSSVTFDLDSHVVNIGNLAFNECSSIKSISIPNTTTNIGYGAFRECKSLTSAIIGNSVTNIQGEAFNGCIGLTNINIPNSVTTIGSVAFARCSGLTTISIGDNVKNIGNDAFKGCNKIGSIYINNIASWCGINFGNEYANPLIYSTTSTYLYEKNEKLTDIDIPNSVSNIKSNAFYNYKNLNRIILASTVTSIGNNAFNGCENLKTVINLTSLSIIKGNEDNGHVAKYASRVVKGTSRINDFIFNKESNKNNELVYHLKNDVTDIRLPSHTDGKYDISNSVFVEHTKLTKFTIPDNTVASIGERVFEGCEQLTDVSIGYGVTNIDNGTFKNCGITSMTIPNTVTNIGNEVFKGCSSLTELNINDNDDGSSDSEPPIIEIGVEPDTSNNNNPLNLGYNTYNPGKEGEGLFKDCPIEELHLGRNITYESDKQYGYSPFTNISSLKSVTIGNGVTEIGNNAFYYCKTLTSVTIGNSVTNIGNNAFYGCEKLIDINIPDSVTSIGYSAFYDSKWNSNKVYINNINNWCKITFKNINSNPLYSGGYLYQNNNTQHLNTIEIPETITNINDYAFAGCHIDEINIKEGVKNIGKCAFYGCGKGYIPNLISVKIPNTIVEIGEYAFAKETDDFITSDNDLSNGSTHSNIENVYINDIASWCRIDFKNKYSNPISSEYVDKKIYLNETELKNIIIPNGVRSIGQYAFYNSTDIKHIIIPNGVRSIGQYAFKWYDNDNNIYNIKRIIIGNDVKNIGEGAFSNLPHVGMIIIGKDFNIDDTQENANYIFSKYSSNNIQVIINFSKYSFNKNGEYLQAIETIHKPSALQEGDFMFEFDILNNNVFLCGYMGEGIGNLQLPSEYKGKKYEIGEYVFYNCDMLENITIPNGVTSIGNKAFKGCTSLKKLHIEDGTDILTLGGNDFDSNNKGLFNDCKSLKSIYLGRSVIPNDISEYFGNGSYFGDSNSTIKTIIIGNEVTIIGESNFRNCTGIKRVIIGENVRAIGTYAFYLNDSHPKRDHIVINLSSLTISKGSTDNGYVGYDAFEVINISNNTIEDDFVFNTPINEIPILYTYIGDDEVLILPDYYRNDICEDGKYSHDVNYNHEDGSYSHLKYIIGHGAFYCCNNLTNVVIGNMVTSIEESAFENCSELKSINIHNRVEYVGCNIFNNCTGLETIIIGKNVKTDCDSLDDMLGVSFRNNQDNFIDNKTIINFSSIKAIENRWCKDITITVNDYKNGYYNKNGVLISDNYVFANINGNNTLCGYINDSVTKLTLPTEYGDYTIGEFAFYEFKNLTTVTIPNTVTSIGGSAFESYYNYNTGYHESNIQYVIFENNSKVKNIGFSAFRGCNKLTNITIPDSVTNIEDYAFYWCGSLENITIGSGVKNIGNYSFSWCDSLESIIIPDNVTTIGYHAFYNCSGLTSVTIGNGVTSIGDHAFYDCENLEYISIGDGVTSIGEYAFENTKINTTELDICYIGKVLYLYNGSDETIEIKDDTLGIAGGAFRNNDYITNIEIPNNVTNIGKNAFNTCKKLTSIVIGENVTTIDDNAFYGCKNLKTVINNSNIKISKGSTSNGYVGFYADEVINTKDEHIVDDKFVFKVISGVNTLYKYIGDDTELTLPANFNGENYVIGDSVFSFYANITSVTIPNSVISIGDNAFYGCKELKNITIPDSIISVGNYTFANCSGLTSIEIPNSVTSIGMWAFEDCNNIKNITIGNSVTEIGYGAFSDCIGIRNVTIPNSVTSIGDYAFYNCYSLTSVTIGSSVTSIGDYAFCDCDLTTIKIPNSVTSIGSHAFYGCDLTKVHIGDNCNTNIKYIGDYAFYNDKTYDNWYPVLETVYLYAKSAPTIGKEVFWINSISNRRTEIHVPKDSRYNGYTVNDWKVYYDASMIKFVIIDIQEST